MTDLELEIKQQPEVIARSLETNWDRLAGLAEVLRQQPPRLVLFVGRGSSGHAALYGKYLLESLLGVPVAQASPSLWSLYGSTLPLRDALVIGISQSGASPDLVTVMAAARRQGARTLAITNAPQSPLAAAAEERLPLNAGVERSVPATKSFSASLALLAALAGHWRGDGGLLGALKEIPSMIAATLATADPAIRTWARVPWDRCLVLGRHYLHPIAAEAALKLREAAQVLALPYAVSEFFHGGLASVTPGMPVLLMAGSGPTLDSALQARERILEAGGHCLFIADAPQWRPDLLLPAPAREELLPLVAAVPGQMLALAMALRKGLNPDQPPGLSKVTLTL